MTQEETTAMVVELRKKHTDRQLEKLIGSNRNTMYIRLVQGGWKVGEIAVIKTL